MLITNIFVHSHAVFFMGKKETKVAEQKPIVFSQLKQFHGTGFFLYPLKTSENQKFTDVCRGYGKRPVA